MMQLDTVDRDFTALAPTASRHLYGLLSGALSVTGAWELMKSETRRTTKPGTVRPDRSRPFAGSPSRGCQ